MAEHPLASSSPPNPTPASPPSPAPTGAALAELLSRAIKANPVLRDQKKLAVKTVSGRVRVEGVVFTRDHYRHLIDLVTKLPGGDQVTILVESEVKPPQPRGTVGRIPLVSAGPSSVDREYSVRHVRKPRRG